MGLSILLAVTSDKRIYFQFLEGPNNEVSVSSFFVSLSNELDNDYPKCKENNLLLMDNCPSQKTKLVRDVLASGGFRVMFSAPASYLALPVESIFGLIKKCDLDEVRTSTLPSVRDRRISKLTNKERAMIKISKLIRELAPEMIMKCF